MPTRIVEAATLARHGSPPLTRSPVSTCCAHLPRWTSPGASVGCFPGPCCLPRTPAGSASTTSLSRPAQALHTLRPVDSLDRQKRPLSQGFDTASYPAAPPASYRANRPLPGWDFHPQGDRALRGAPEHADNIQTHEAKYDYIAIVVPPLFEHKCALWFVQLGFICVFCVHRLPASAIRLLLREATRLDEGCRGFSTPPPARLNSTYRNA